MGLTRYLGTGLGLCWFSNSNSRPRTNSEGMWSFVTVQSFHQVSITNWRLRVIFRRGLVFCHRPSLKQSLFVNSRPQLIFRRGLVFFNRPVTQTRWRYKIKITSDIQKGSYPSLLSGRKLKTTIHHFQTMVVSYARILSLSPTEEFTRRWLYFYVPNTFESPYTVVTFFDGYLSLLDCLTLYSLLSLIMKVS